MKNVALVMFCSRCHKKFFISTTRPEVIDDLSNDIAENIKEGCKLRVMSLDEANKLEFCDC